MQVTLWTQSGSGSDRFIQFTEGVMPEEDLGPRQTQRTVTLETAQNATLELNDPGEWFRFGASWPATPGERLTGLGSRHCVDFDQSGRRLQLGADRSYTGPDCPPDMLEVGGIPQGDYAPVPWLLSSAGWAVWIETDGPGCEVDLSGEEIAVSVRSTSGKLRLHFFREPTPLARLRSFLRRTGLPALLPEWAYGHWKSRDIYWHQDDVLDDFEGYLRHQIPLDAIVIDSPWETQYNTWHFNPRQFPDPEGMVGRMLADGVRTVVWVTPWVNLESADGQYPRDSQTEREHREPASNYEEGSEGGHFVQEADGSPFVARWWMGTGSPVDLTSPTARGWWKRQANPVLRMGVAGIKADDGEGYYFPPHLRFADGRTAAEAAWDFGRLYRETMQEALDEVHPGEGVVFGRSGWTGQQSTGMLWGGDQASDYWSLRALVTATLTSAASGFSNWSHDVGGYLGKLLVERCPAELLVRWAQFGCFTPLMQAHGRFEQEAWRYDPRTLAIYRDFVLLHERLVPYVRAAAATAARTGVPIVRPLCLIDPGDPQGWTIADAYGYGPALWVAPVVEEHAESRRVYLPRGTWIDFWSTGRVEGGRWIEADAPLDRIPVWVRDGSLIVTYPAEVVAEGLGLVREGDDAGALRPLEATLWGMPRLGRAGAKLADGTAIRWHRGSWSCSAEREVRYAKLEPN